MQTINKALEYLESGLSVIPVKVDKSPSISGWKIYQSELMTKDKAFNTFADAPGVALIGGKISGGVEIIDFDNHFGDAPETFNKFCKLPEVKDIVKDMLTQQTPSGGYHLIYRCPNPEKNKKLAQRINPAGKAETLIETRGEAGYALVYPSPNYNIIKGSFPPKTITVEERNILIASSMAFNEHARPEQTYFHDTFGRDSDRPGDEYNTSSDGRAEVPILLLRDGWKTSDGKHWTRPGKERGVSATWGKVTHNGVPVFYCFSSNGGVIQDNKYYKPFQLFALLAHNGDFDAAAKELRQRGFGKESQSKEVYSEAMRSIKKGINIKSVNYNELANELQIDEQKVKDEFQKIYSENADEFNFDNKPDVEKAEIFLRKNFAFRRNVVSQKIEMKVGSQNWERLNEHTIFRMFQYNRIKYSFEKIKSLLRSDFVPDFHPFIEFFNALPAWDGVDYFHEMVKFVKTPFPEFFARMLEKHFVRAIKCAIDDNYYNRIVFTMVSTEQNIGKSFLIRFWNPFGSEYYSEEPLRDNKDSAFALAENFIYSLEELDELSKMDVGRLKAIISRSGINERVPYEAQKIYLPRRCTFFGSTNRTEFLLDDRNTRWLVFPVEDIDYKGYMKEIKCIDLWIQAWTRFNDVEFDPELSPDEANWRDQNNKGYQIQEAERTIIIKELEPSTCDSEFMTNVDILNLLADQNAKLKLSTSTQKIGRIMSELGYTSGQRIINGKNCRVYYCRPISVLKRMNLDKDVF